jgi:hypothetical protein
MRICRINFNFFDRTDVKNIAFERRRKCFFVPCPAWSANFDSLWHQKLELYKIEVFGIHNV